MGSNRLSRLTVGIAVAAVACNGSTAAAPTPSPSPTAATASPSLTHSPAPSPSPTEVLPANDVDDPVAALEAIVAYRDHLFENPDPDKLALIYAERCECYDEVHRVLSDFDADGRRIVLKRLRLFSSSEVLEREGPFARIQYEVDSPPAELVDSRGETVQQVEQRSAGPAEAFLVREEGRWRVVAMVLS